MNLICLDTEFTGLDQDHPDLISIGLVDETGSEFYAELPAEHYAVQCNVWVHHNVLPLLRGGDHVHCIESIRALLTEWFADISDKAMIITDCPDADFRLLKALLPVWPPNLEPDPALFSAWVLGDEQQPELSALMSNYHTPTRPKHNSLHDANSLRVGVLYALEHGWRGD